MIINRLRNLIAISVASIDMDLVKGVPHRWWNDNTKKWYAPVTPRVVQYLRRFTGREQTEMLDKALSDLGPRAIPIGFQFKTKPYPHQEEALRRMAHKAAFALFMEPGLGKTKTIIDDSNLALGMGVIQAQAIVCPNSIKSNWADEIEIHSGVEVDIMVYEPSKKKAIKKWIAEPSPRMKWFIMAVESLSSGDGAAVLESFLDKQPAGLAVDESSRIKTHDANRTKVMLKMGRKSPRRRVATGTPITKGLQDAWAQFEFLDPEILCKNFYAHRNTFCVMGEHKQVVASKNEEDYIDLTANYVMVALKSECLNLPPKVYQTRLITPTPVQVKAYKDLSKLGYAEVEGGAISFQNVLVKNLRLQQMCGGFAAVEADLAAVFARQTMLSVDDLFAMLEEGRTPQILKDVEKVKTVPLEGENPKIKELLAIAEEYPGKTLVWCRFRPEIDAVVTALREVYGDNAVVEFHGGIDDNGRTDARRRLQSDPECRFFVAQIATGGIGITLTAATTSIYFSNDWSLENRIQSEDRNHRIGTTGTVVYIDLVLDVPYSVDKRILASLKAGRNYTDTLMLDMKEATR